MYVIFQISYVLVLLDTSELRVYYLFIKLSLINVYILQINMDNIVDNNGSSKNNYVDITTFIKEVG